MTTLKHKLNFIRSICTLLLAAFVLHSCSNNEDAGKTYTIARTPSWSTSNFMGKEKNITAFSDELLLTIAKKADIKIRIVNSTSGNPMSGLLNKEYDGVLIEIIPTSLLQKTLVFSNPYFLLGPVLVTGVDSNVQSIEDMNGKTIGIEKGSSLVFETEKYPSLIVTSYDNIFKALGALDNDKIDGVLMEALPAFVYTKTFYPNRLKVATKPLTSDGLRLVTLKKSSNEKLINAFNEGLKTMLEDGSYDEMIKKWGLVNTSQ